MSKWLSFNFTRVSLIYFLLGAFWMGLGEAIRLPRPQAEFAGMLYNWGMLHVIVLGWASFAIIGAIYYLVPRAAERDLYSLRLGKIHFWITNITFPIGIFLIVWGSFVADSLLATGLSDEQVLAAPSFFPFFMIYLIVFIIGYAAQFVFAYNVYKTMAAKA